MRNKSSELERIGRVRRFGSRRSGQESFGLFAAPVRGEVRIPSHDVEIQSVAKPEVKGHGN
jgi:hypothetical protein